MVLTLSRRVRIIRALMPTGLPDLIDPLLFCQQGRIVSGVLPIELMERLRKELLAPLTEAEIELRFSINGGGFSVITGSVLARVTAQCQRCLSPVELEINIAVQLQVVKDDAEAKELSQGWDPLVFDGGELPVMQMVEDELLVGLPTICLHESPQCQQPAVTTPQAEVPGSSSQVLSQVEERPNPFQVLSGLKKAED